jgi:3-phosphoshikimate 1-carboxyvinyltransferase
MTVRAFAAGLLADGPSTIRNASLCDDALTAMDAIEDLGAVVVRKRRDFIVRGTGGLSFRPGRRLLDCRESGLSMRMFAPIAALVDTETTLVASGSLGRRPMGMVRALEQLGVACQTDDGHAPITVRGPMRGGRIGIDASVSSQFLTGLLAALPLCEHDSHILVTGLRSTPYVRMTVGLLNRFGVRIEHDEGVVEFAIKGGQIYSPSVYAVEGDWSGASFLLVAGATAGAVTVTGLDPESLQADRAILEVLDMAGAPTLTDGDSVSVESRDLKPFSFDATDCPDLFPPLVALASGCEGKSLIYGVERLTHKESDRASALTCEFGKLGITVTTTGNRMEVHGGRIGSGLVDSHGDHRIAMACAVAALCAQGSVEIGGSECVAKSYPRFFEDLETLRRTG